MVPHIIGEGHPVEAGDDLLWVHVAAGTICQDILDDQAYRLDSCFISGLACTKVVGDGTETVRGGNLLLGSQELTDVYVLPLNVGEEWGGGQLGNNVCEDGPVHLEFLSY